MTLTSDDKKTITKLTAEGKIPSEIAKIMGIKYITIYNYTNRIERSVQQKIYRDSKRKHKIIELTSTDKYVDTGKVMPPTYKTNLTIIADKNLVELACQQMGLKPPVCSLAERPSASNIRGLERVGNKWVASADTGVTGRVRHCGVGSLL